MRKKDFTLIYLNCCIINVTRQNFKCGGSYIDSPDWINKKKVTMNSKNKDDKCFQYAVTVALNYEEINWNPERVSNI